jgi:hypothetical protein
MKLIVYCGLFDQKHLNKSKCIVPITFLISIFEKGSLLLAKSMTFDLNDVSEHPAVALQLYIFGG